MTNYVVGFMFDQKAYGVLLIEKQKPLWQKGKFNGIGGKIEEGENPYDAMAREFKEETGVETDVADWKYVVSMSGEDWCVKVFTCKDDCIHNAKTMELEKVNYIPLDELDGFDIISNLTWLIPMCLDSNKINYTITKELDHEI